MGSDYLLHFNLDDGQTIEVPASYEQLDLISKEIDRLLDDDERDALGTEESSGTATAEISS